MQILKKIPVIALLLFIVANILVVLTYPFLEKSTFPNVDEKYKFTEHQTKSLGDGGLLIDSIFNQLDRELNSPLGWVANDIFPATYILDNKPNRQKGIIFTTRMLEEFFSTKLSKYGKAGNENPQLKKIREELIVFSAEKWGILFLPSPESKYREAINLKEIYKKDLAEGKEIYKKDLDNNIKAIYNLKTNDLYDLLNLITNEKLLDQAIGEVMDDTVSFDKIDDKIYYVQGVVLVLRDFVGTLAMVDENQIFDKGATENLKVALANMDEIANFNPIMVVNGKNDSMLADHMSKVAKYLTVIDKRLTDVALSIRR